MPATYLPDAEGELFTPDGSTSATLIAADTERRQ